MEHKSSFDSSGDGQEMYTKDTFKCSICGTEKWSIDDYVEHMLEEEKCVMVLENSRYLKYLSLPRFRRKADCKKYENSEEEKESSLFAIEVEVSKGVTRWKCRMCGLTFSREAAVLNHYKLAEHEVPVGVATSKIPALKTVKMEINERNVDLSPSTTSVDEQDNKLPLTTIKIQNTNPVCHICGQIFKSVSIVASHIKIVHSEKRPFVCSVKDCNLSFKTKGSLVRHTRRHTGDRPYKCNLCGRAYRESGSLLRHQQSKISCSHKPDSHLPRYGITLPFVCGVKSDGEAECKFSLKKEASEDDEESVPLLDSQEAEETKAKVRKEIMKNQGLGPISQDVQHEKKPLLKITKKEKKEFGISEGEQEIINKFDINFPEDEAEDKIVRKCFTCPLCYKSYTNVTYLSTHMKTHLAELGNECCTCKKKFSSDHALARHLLTHSSSRQFECKQCGKAFKLRSHAVNHLKSHSNSKTIPCHECGSLFKSVSSRNTHLKIHAQERNYECSVCFKTFLVKASFIRHLNVHSKGRWQNPQVDRKSKLEMEDVDSKSVIKRDLTEEETLEDVAALSEVDSELDSFLSEKFDMSSIYSEKSELSPEDYLLPNC